MRFFIALAMLVAGTAGGFLVYRELTLGPPVVLSAPTRVTANAVGATLVPGVWTSSPTIKLSAASPRVVAAGLDVEVRPQGTPFTNTPTATDTAAKARQVACAGSPSCPVPDPSITVHLPDGRFHLQLRFHNGQGISRWVRYHGVIMVDTQPPLAPQVSSPTDPNPGTLYHSSTMSFMWQTSDSGSGLAGYSYRLDTDPGGVAREDIRTPRASVTLVGLDTGKYYFHVRARDNAGNWGPSATFPVRIDVTPPGLAHVRFNEFQFDPQFDPLQVSFAVTRAASVVRLGVYRQSDSHLVRLYTLTHLSKGQHTAVVWDGRNARGHLVRPGLYSVYVRTIDRYGHTRLRGWNDFVVDYKRILVSLSQQKLYAYDGNQLLLTSLVTTGNRALPTPTGTFQILAKFHPFTFHSPWPKSSPFYYPPSKVAYAMLFQAAGYFIHDAPWRSAFGPGTNAQLGTPGTNYTGTHGCVNTPPDVAQRLFAWTDIGTIVQVVQ